MLIRRCSHGNSPIVMKLSDAMVGGSLLVCGRGNASLIVVVWSGCGGAVDLQQP